MFVFALCLPCHFFVLIFQSVWIQQLNFDIVDFTVVCCMPGLCVMCHELCSWSFGVLDVISMLEMNGLISKP